jgi:nucleotide-binding universal stress UspA family protein
MRLLLALDFVDSTERLLAAVVPLAKATGGTVHLLHVAEPDPSFVGFEAGPDVVRDQVAHQFRDERRMLESHAAALGREGIETHVRMVRGPVATSILAEAQAIDAEIIVMGTHGRSALYEAVVGSVSHGVLLGTRVPVLLVPVKKV